MRADRTIVCLAETGDKSEGDMATESMIGVWLTGRLPRNNFVASQSSIGDVSILVGRNSFCSALSAETPSALS